MLTTDCLYKRSVKRDENAKLLISSSFLAFFCSICESICGDLGDNKRTVPLFRFIQKSCH